MGSLRLELKVFTTMSGYALVLRQNSLRSPKWPENYCVAQTGLWVKAVLLVQRAQSPDSKVRVLGLAKCCPVGEEDP